MRACEALHIYIPKSRARTLRAAQVLYCSRTHSQIAQFVREAKRTGFGNIRCVSLASRRFAAPSPRRLWRSKGRRAGLNCGRRALPQEPVRESRSHASSIRPGHERQMPRPAKERYKGRCSSGLPVLAWRCAANVSRARAGARASDPRPIDTPPPSTRFARARFRPRCTTLRSLAAWENVSGRARTTELARLRAWPRLVYTLLSARQATVPGVHACRARSHSSL